MKGRPSDFAAVVRANWPKVTAYVVSSDHTACLRMAKDEVEHIDRIMQHVPLAEISRLRPKPQWFMAVVVCPHDDLTDLAAWAADHGADAVHFYLHRDTPIEVLRPWVDAGLSLPHVEEERFLSWGPLHRRLGLDLSDWVYGGVG